MFTCSISRECRKLQKCRHAVQRIWSWKSWANWLPPQKPADHNLKIPGCKITPLILCHFFLAHLMRLFLRQLACSSPGPRRMPPTQHRAACYSSVCPQGAWTSGHKPHSTLGQRCLSLSGADMSLAAFGCLHRSSVCKETTMLPSICERKANRSGSRYVPPSAGWFDQQVFMYWTKQRQQWLGSIRMQTWKVLSASASYSSHWELLKGWKLTKKACLSLNYLSQGS